MNWTALTTAFGLIFVAEMGDKTQLAVITLAARTSAPVSVFVGASLALVAVTLLGAVGGAALTRVVPEPVLQKVAALAFIAIGVFMLIRSG
jgi:putative Ca2+/H+ antiporter (TMEM165/GDT1 family)